MSRDEAPHSPNLGNKKRTSGGSVTSASPWSKLYTNSDEDWGKLFVGMVGKTLQVPNNIMAPWYHSPSGNICADSIVAYMVAVRMHQVVRCLCNFKVPNSSDSSEAEVTTQICLMISCVQSCDANSEHRVIQHDPPSSEHSDEDQVEHSAAEAPQEKTQQQVVTPDKPIATDPSHTSEDASPSHVSGSQGSLQGPGHLGEERRFKVIETCSCCQTFIQCIAHQCCHSTS
jgi:hypothetical protein